MRIYEITYKYDGKEHTTIEQPQKDGGIHPEKKSQYLYRVLNRIESLVQAGAVITDVKEIRQ